MTASLKRFRIGDFATVGSGTTPARAKATRYFSSSGHEWVKTGDLTNSVVRSTDEKITPAAVAESNCRLYPSGTVLVAMYGGLRQIGRTGLLERPAAVNQAISAIQVDPTKAHPEYLLQYLNHAVDGWKQFAASSRKDPNITRQDVESFPVPLPPLPEQRKIASVLRSWDEAIERTETLIRAETQMFGVLRRRLFDASEDEVPLSEVSTRITTKSDGAPHTVMTISAKTGFVAQADKYRRDMAGASLAKYTLLRRGEFAYNKGNSLTYPQGCIYALKEDSALVPNVYYSFRLRRDLNSSYYEHFFASGALNRQLAQRISSGVRGNGLLNLNAGDFFSVKVPVPNRGTQDSVADTLNMGNRKIELLQRKSELLSTQKRGLMQKLLTGRMRVNVAAEIEPGGPDGN